MKKAEQGTAIVKIVAIITMGIVVIVISKYLIDKPGKVFKEISETFTKGIIVTIFKDSVTKAKGTNYLQIAELDSTETFSRTDSIKILWEKLSLPDVEVEIRSPVKYTFYLDLNEKWKFVWQEQDQAIIVFAPQIKYNMPAIDISEMRFIEIKKSILRDEESVKEKLKQEITNISFKMAEKKIPLIREIARNETRKFVETWLIESKFFKDSKIKPHVKEVYFADEQSDTIKNTSKSNE